MKSAVILWTAMALGLLMPAAAQILLDDSYRYSWSSSATMILTGTITAKTIVDSERTSSPYTVVRLGIRTIQRGSPAGSAIQVIVEDDLNIGDGQRDRYQIGQSGFWFLHRVSMTDTGVQEARLIRYISAQEMSADPSFIREITAWVIEDTIDQRIDRGILRHVGTLQQEGEQSVTLELRYGETGELVGVEKIKASGNRLFDEHVAAVAVDVHRTMRFPGASEITAIEIVRRQ